jgi:S1-C subfamily serine protease
MALSNFLARTLILFAAVYALHSNAIAQTTEPKPNKEKATAVHIENAVVKIFSTVRNPDLYRPWSKASPQEITGSGVVIEGNRILTNAHVVNYASQVQIQARKGGDKLTASVVAIARGIDLAVLKLDDESFFATHPAPTRSAVLPEIKDNVLALGYPTGGTSLSITKGIVSRIEFVPYSNQTAGLRIQIDAAINPGNSGGPVIANDKIVGLAFSGVTNAQNIGYIIPTEEIELFLKDIADGNYNGKPAFFDDVQTLENPALRTFLKLNKSVQGVIVQRPVRTDANYPLKEWDLITHVGDTPIDNQGLVKLTEDINVQFQYLTQNLSKNGRLPLTIIRGGKTLNIQLPVTPGRPRLIPSLAGAYPSYFIYGPLVFSKATSEFRRFISGDAGSLNAYAANGSPLVTRVGDEPDANREELVVISAPFFPHKLVSGYDSRFGAVVYAINEKPIRSLRHLVAVLRDLKDDLVVIKFDQKSSENIVLPRKEMLAASEEILNENGIRAQGSKDMLDVWLDKSAQ